jgi:hypothetical protein
MAKWETVSFEDGVDTKIATHAGNASAHHAKYTDSEAVAAVVAGDNYLKNDAADVTTHALSVEGILSVDNPGTLHAAGSSIKCGNNSGPELSLQCSRDVSWARGLFMLIRSRGSVASPTALQNGDTIAGIGFKGYDGSATQLTGIIEAYVDGAVSGGVLPTRISFITGTTGGNRTERLKIKSDGVIDMCNNPVKDMKNHAASALSGTKKLIEIDIGGTSYYFEVYPTKA